MARTLKNTFLHWTRALHTYMTMLALILLMFFSVTGFLLNHKDWFDIGKYDDPVRRAASTNLPAKLLTDRGGLGTEHGYQLEAYLRQHEGAKGEVVYFDDSSDSTISVQFQGPGIKMEYAINRMAPPAPDSAPADAAANPLPEDEKPKQLGQIDVSVQQSKTLNMLGDMHRGVGTGRWWRLLIDGASIFLMLASLSGVILWISMPKRRRLGIIALAAGIGICAGCWIFLLA